MDMTSQISGSVTDLMQEFGLITNNLANVNTAGFKRSCNAFSKVFQQTLENGNETAESAEMLGGIDFSQGNLIHTERPLDFALCGEGFWVIETPEGPLYTRTGNFQLNQNGQITDGQGRIITGQGGPINLPANTDLSEINVSEHGNISIDGIFIDKFKIVEFGADQKQLQPYGAGSFTVSEDIKPKDAENVLVRQHFQESSNVQMIEELVDMIMVTRMYEANMSFLKAGSELSNSLISVAMA